MLFLEQRVVLRRKREKRTKRGIYSNPRETRRVFNARDMHQTTPAFRLVSGNDPWNIEV